VRPMACAVWATVRRGLRARPVTSQLAPSAASRAGIAEMIRNALSPLRVVDWTLIGWPATTKDRNPGLVQGGQELAPADGLLQDVQGDDWRRIADPRTGGERGPRRTQDQNEHIRVAAQVLGAAQAGEPRRPLGRHRLRRRDGLDRPLGQGPILVGGLAVSGQLIDKPAERE